MKTTIVTGGNKGIGLDISRAFVAAGYKVFVAAREDTGISEELGENAIFVPVDVRIESEHTGLVDRVLKEQGRLDVFVNNAGLSGWKPLEQIEDDFLDLLINTNLKSVFWGCKAAAKSMKSGGSIINISSIAGKRGSANNAAYCATKFGVNGVTQSLAKEMGPSGIRVNALCPVLIKTPGLIEALRGPDAPGVDDPDLFIDNFRKANAALGRLPTGEEVGNTAVFLASKEASAITGQCLNIDCGVFPQ